MSDADKLRDLIDNTWPTTITNIDKSITNLNLEKSELEDQIDAVEYAQGELETSSTSILNGKGFIGMVFGSKYGTENLLYFAGYNEQDTTVSPASYNNADSFDVSGDLTSLFSSSTIVNCDCGVDGIIQRTVQSSTYLAPNTTVNLSAGTPITSNLSSVDVVDGDIEDATRINNNSFTVNGDRTSFYTSDKIIVCVDSSDLVRTIDSSSYSVGPDETTVTLIDDTISPITASLTGIIDPDYLYEGTGWDSDATLISNNSSFEDTYDHLNDPMGINGTYGLNDKKDKIDTAITLQQNDKAKYQSFITLYEPYAS